MNNTVSLEKKTAQRQETLVSLVKNTALATQQARVILVMDISGSMNHLYQDGTVQDVIERIVPLALQFDDDQRLELVLFHNNVMPAGTVTMRNLAGFVQRDILGSYSFGGTSYAPFVRSVRKMHGPMGVNQALYESRSTAPSSGGGLFGGLFSKKAAAPAVPANVRVTAAQMPTFVIVVTDGDNDDHSATEQQMREASAEGIYFQFVGIGAASFGFLDKLDNLSGRVVDNAGFFKATDINRLDDKELYAKLLKEFPTWLAETRKLGILA